MRVEFPKKIGKTLKTAPRYSLAALLVFEAVYGLVKAKRRAQAKVSVPLRCKVKQTEEEITLSWPDFGDSYQVFRGHTLIYSGKDARVTDKNLEPGTIYSYTIEKLNDQNKVINRMKVQTATLAAPDREENLLLDLAFTAVVSKGEISLSWEAIDGIRSYTILRNGVEVAETEACHYTDQDIKGDQEYLYTIRAQRPLPRSEQETFALKSLVSSVVGMVKKDSSQAQAVMEEITLTKRIWPTEELLRQMDEKPKRQERSWLLRYSTFLPEKMLENPNVTSPKKYFSGDDRSFEPDSESFRTRADVYIQLKDGQCLFELSKEVGKTTSYDKNKQFYDEDKASDDNIELRKGEVKEGKTTFMLEHSVGNPLVVSPAVDYKVVGSVYRNGEINMAGYHDQAPHHEVYLKELDHPYWDIVHLGENKGLEMMAHPTANHLWRYSTFEQ